ncbi:hypothetical protein SAMN05216588_1269 [Pseudomonas flavescens]|uniref:Mu-like prophage FluMu N-terminal domain-containing protein n=1 Tax=Phytopseudomonas flavescens TaxID=29435 RepID=A0A1G8NTQ3_9GAMM|nr:HI1506-related protein [Pseudomonas flavescens]SDI83553.1 hypothetical protein SAMN05216588_1269 [Pseudomonas flavescens]
MGLLITAMAEGFRRAGVAHSSTATYWPDDSFTEEQLQHLREEPKLVVIEGAQPPEELLKVLADEQNTPAASGGTTEVSGAAPTKAPATKPAKATGAKAPVKDKAGAKTPAKKPVVPAAQETPKGDAEGKVEGSEGAGE